MALPALGTTTTLDAINTILAALGESPINTLDGPLTSDVSMALNTLNEVSKEVQSEGWVCNTEHGYPFTPTSGGEIRVSPNISKIILPQHALNASVVLRGTRLYDLANHTFAFSEPVLATVVFLLPFEELTETLRRYIIIKAGRLFQDRAVGSPQLHGFHEDDEFRAYAAARHEDAEMGRWNIQKNEQGGFLSGWNVADVLRR
jgi:hypothetical protein